MAKWPVKDPHLLDFFAIGRDDSRKLNSEDRRRDKLFSSGSFRETRKSANLDWFVAAAIPHPGPKFR